MSMSTDESFLANIHNFAYNVLKYTGDNIIRDKETPEPSHCSECAQDILSLPFKAITVLACGHISHRHCLENRILCEKNISPACLICLVPIEITKEEFAFASGNYNLVASLSQKSSDTLEDEEIDLESQRDKLHESTQNMELVDDNEQDGQSKHQSNIHLQDVTPIVDTPDSISTSYQERSPNGAVNTSPDNSKAQNNILNSTIARTQDSLVTKSNVQNGTEKNSRKRPRKVAPTKIVGKVNKKKESVFLKEIIRELSNMDSWTNVSLQQEIVSDSNRDSADFLNLYIRIVNAEEQNKKTNQEVVLCYYNYGKELEDRLNYYKRLHPKQTAKMFVNEEVRKQLTQKTTEDSLRKNNEKARKIYKLFNGISGDSSMTELLIQRISFSASSISKLSKSDIEYVVVSVLQNKQFNKQNN